jgi:hypothetical protein
MNNSAMPISHSVIAQCTKLDTGRNVGKNARVQGLAFLGIGNPCQRCLHVISIGGLRKSSDIYQFA